MEDRVSNVLREHHKSQLLQQVAYSPSNATTVVGASAANENSDKSNVTSVAVREHGLSSKNRNCLDHLLQ